jgi:hypothetical protein
MSGQLADGWTSVVAKLLRKGWPFVALWSLGAAAILRTALLQSASPHPHFAPDSWPLVAGVLLLMAGEASGLAALLLSGRGYRSPSRWLLASGTAFALVVAFGLGAMHASNAVFLHVLWLAAVDLLCVGGLLASLIVKIARRAKG